MPTLDTETGKIFVPKRLILRQADRLWRLPAVQRAHHIEKARKRLASGKHSRSDAALVLGVEPASLPPAAVPE
jgi:hypothetical protein